MNKLVILLGLIAICSCEGSPVATSKLSPQELRIVDDYTLCMAATPRELFTPAKTVLDEVERRELDCSSIYQWKGPFGN